MTTTAKRATWLASIGAGLEYYDFVIYGMMAGYLSDLFFPQDQHWIALIKTFGVFAAGYLARPFGGIFFGLLGDTFGRKNAFVTVMLLMAVSTFAIGLLPTHSQWGMMASISLVVLRVLQGLSFGAELPGAITVVSEYTQKRKYGAYFGFIFSSVSLGSAFAAFVLYLLSRNFEQTHIVSWAWRIPFLLGGSLAIANYFIRRYLQETPDFLILQKSRNEVSLKTPVRLLCHSYKTELLLGIGMTLFISSLVIFALYMPTYLNVHYGYAKEDIFLVMTWSQVWPVFFLPLCGYVADRIGKKRVLTASCLFFVFGGFYYFKFLEYHDFALLFIFMMLYQSLISTVTVSFFPILSTLFPTAGRYTGIAACYNISYSIMGMLPLLLTALIEYTGNPMSVLWVLQGCALITCLCGLGIFETERHREHREE